MMLHMLHSTQHFDECRALLVASDTLLLMDPSVIESGLSASLTCHAQYACYPNPARLRQTH